MADIPIKEIQEASIIHQMMLHRTKITMKKILSLPIAKRAIYADPITKKYADQEWFFKSQIDEMVDDPESWNLTSVANISYMILHVRDVQTVEKYRQVWNNYKTIKGIRLSD